ncbi:copper amine oxidase [Aspergillus heterothallicus]
MTHIHPLDPATAEEIQCATNIVKSAYKEIKLHFKAAGLEEPLKAAMVHYLEAEHKNQPLPTIPRCIFLIWYIKKTLRLFEAIVDINRQNFVHHKELLRDFHGSVDRAEMNEAAQVVIAYARLLLAHPGSFHSRRSEICSSPIWVTKHKDRQLFPASDYTNQPLGATGIKSWLDEVPGKRENVRNDDIVIWHPFGSTHNPRTEDFRSCRLKLRGCT